MDMSDSVYPTGEHGVNAATKFFNKLNACTYKSLGVILCLRWTCCLRQ